MKTPRLTLLFALPTLAGCSVGLPSLDADGGMIDGVATQAMDPEGDAFGDTDAWGAEIAGDLLADFPLSPRIEAFDVEPAALPLGGGPVLVSWAAEDVAHCAVVVDNVPAVDGVEGELMIDVAEDADIHLVCLDQSQALVAEARAGVTVVQPPVDSFEPDESLELAPWQAAQTLGRSGEQGEVHEVAVVMPDDGRLVVDVTASPERAQFELWLAADADGDGVLASAEVIDVTRSSESGRIDQLLPAGEYSLFVVSVTGAATWHLDLAVVLPNADGSNF